MRIHGAMCPLRTRVRRAPRFPDWKSVLGLSTGRCLSLALWSGSVSLQDWKKPPGLTFAPWVQQGQQHIWLSQALYYIYIDIGLYAPFSGKTQTLQERNKQAHAVNGNTAWPAAE